MSVVHRIYFAFFHFFFIILIFGCISFPFDFILFKLPNFFFSLFLTAARPRRVTAQIIRKLLKLERLALHSIPQGLDFKLGYGFGREKKWTERGGE